MKIKAKQLVEKLLSEVSFDGGATGNNLEAAIDLVGSPMASTGNLEWFVCADKAQSDEVTKLISMIIRSTGSFGYAYDSGAKGAKLRLFFAVDTRTSTIPVFGMLSGITVVAMTGPRLSRPSPGLNGEIKEFLRAGGFALQLNPGNYMASAHVSRKDLQA